MKKFIKFGLLILTALFSIYLILFSINACSNNISKGNNSQNSKEKINSNNTDKISVEDFTVYDADTKSNIAIGMTKDEVDKLLGIQESKDFKSMYNYQGLEVFYRNDKVAGMVVKASTNITSRYTASKKIGLGNNRDEILKAYGECLEKNNSRYMTYYYEKRGNFLVKVSEISKTGENSKTDNLYCISYSLFDTDKISMFLVGDYQYAMNMK